MKPIKLDQATIDLLVGEVTKQNPEKNNQQKRLIQYLGASPNAFTEDVVMNSGVKNISAVARKVNKEISKFGYLVGSFLEVTPPFTKRSASRRFKWGVFIKEDR